MATLQQTPRTYRAAILFSADRQGSTVLTGPEHASLDEAALRAEAQREIDRAGIRTQIEGATIEIGDWIQ